MPDQEIRRTELARILESFGLTFDPSGGAGGEVKISGFGKCDEFRRMVVHGYRSFPQQVVRNIRRKFCLKPENEVSDEDFYGRA